MRSLLLTFDIEPFVLGKDFDKGLGKEQSDRIALNGLDSLASFLEETGAKSTLFVSYDFSKLCKGRLKKLAGQGHEIALHGYSHSDNYAEMDEGKAVERIRGARERMESDFSLKIAGFRAPKMQAPAPSVLKSAGLSYDSSLHPTFLPGYYNNFFKPRNVFSRNGVKEVPVSVTPIARLPFSWFFFRNLGVGYAKMCSRLCLLNSNFLNLYFHNWEFLDLEGKGFEAIPKKFRRNSGRKFEASLGKYIGWAGKKGLQDRTITEFLELA